MSTNLPPLLTIVLLFQRKTGFTDLPHVVSSVSTFLDSAVELPLSAACKFRSLVLLDRIWNSSDFKPGTSGGPWTLHRYLRTDHYYMQHQFNSSLLVAVRLHDLKMIQWLFDRFHGFAVDGMVVVTAVSCGHKDILQFFLDNDNNELEGEALDMAEDSNTGQWVEWHKMSMQSAILARRNDIVWWLNDNLPAVRHDLDRALDAAVCQDDVIMAEWLVEQGAKWHRPAQRGVHHGHLATLKWLAVKHPAHVDIAVGLVVQAAQGGHFHIVRWLIEDRAATDKRLCSLGGEASLSIHAACANGHLEIARFLRGHAAKPRSCSERTIEATKQRETVATIATQDFWIRVSEIATPVSGETMTEAAGKGFLDVVQWLYAEYGGQPDVDLFECGDVNEQTGLQPMETVAMDAAASSGHLDVLKYLHNLQISIALQARKRERCGELKAQSKPYCTDKAMASAAGHGHFEVVKWLHDNQALVYSSDAVDAAAANGHLKLVQLMLLYGAEGCTLLAVDGAARSGHMEMVKWLHANTSGACTTAAMDGAAGNGHLDVVQWLHEHRPEGCTTEAMDAAARNGHLKVVKWLHRNRNEGGTTTAMDGAAGNGHFRVVEWLQKHRSEGEDFFLGHRPVWSRWVLVTRPQTKSGIPMFLGHTL